MEGGEGGGNGVGDGGEDEGGEGGGDEGCDGGGGEAEGDGGGGGGGGGGGASGGGEAAAAHKVAMSPPGGSPLPRRPQLLPVPAADVLYAARHSLLREVRHAAAAVATPRGPQGTAAEAAEAARRLGALRLWVSALARGVPRAVDGGLLARGLAELEVEMDAWEEADLPGEQQWAGMLQRAGISEPSGSQYLSEAATRLVMCTSAMPARHGYPCSLWLLFHTLLARSSHPPAHTPQL